MTPEEIERAFVGAGWQIAEISSPSLVVGNAEELPLSILAYGAMIGTDDDPAFELLDRERATTY